MGIRTDLQAPAAPACRVFQMSASCLYSGNLTEFTVGYFLLYISMLVLQPTTYNLQSTTYNLQPTTYNYNLLPSTCFLQPATFSLQPSTYNLQPTTYNLQPTTYKLQPTTYNLWCFDNHVLVHAMSMSMPFQLRAGWVTGTITYSSPLALPLLSKHCTLLILLASSRGTSGHSHNSGKAR